MNLTVFPIKITSTTQKHSQKSHNQNLQNDVFVKSSQPNFTNNLSFSEKQKFERDFSTSLYIGDIESLLASYEKNPKDVEVALYSFSELTRFQTEDIDKKFGFNKVMEWLQINSYDKNISLLNKTLLLGRYNNVLSPLLNKIAQSNPGYFNAGNIISMYANGECEEAISSLAQKDPEKVFLALEQGIYNSNGRNQEKHLAIENLKITPKRQKVFETLFSIDPLRTSYIISAMPAQRKKEFKFDESKGNADVEAILNVINSKGDDIEANKQLLALYDKSPETMMKALFSLNKKTGKLYINSMMSDTKRSYYGIMLCILLKDPDSFFELAKKSECIWHAAANKKQSYLELLEQALFVDAKKTKNILDIPTINTMVSPRTTVIMECVDNETFDYTELLKAFYQEDKDVAFELFDSNADGDNLLTYYVNQKGYRAEDFISYLTNQNLRFVKTLLSTEALSEIKDLRYKTAMKNLQKAKTELENEFGRKLSETEKRVMERISGVEQEMRREVERLDKRIDGTRFWLGLINNRVNNELYPWRQKTAKPINNYVGCYTGTTSSFLNENFYDGVSVDDEDW
ncbi:hypothetical protein IJ425_01120 [bacterium]|nr:hypothetical protein [bacterium]